MVVGLYVKENKSSMFRRFRDAEHKRPIDSFNTLDLSRYMSQQTRVPD